MKMTTTLAAGTLLAATAAASGALLRLNLVHTASNGGGMLPDTNTWRLYAEFDDPNDQLTSVYSSIPWLTAIMCPEGFYQNWACGGTAASVNAAFAWAVPSMQYDSWVTIGGEWAHECGTLSTTNISFDYFEDSSNAPGALAFLFGSWNRPVNDPWAFGKTVPGLPNYQVLVGQFTTFGTPAATGPWGRLNLKGYSWNFGFNGGELVEWTAVDLEFGNPDTSAGACCIEDSIGSDCELLVATACEQLGGIWHGAGTSCEEVQCGEVPLGACCYLTADFGMVCEVLSDDDCGSASGFWYGEGSVCSDIFVECDPIPAGGACCYDHSVYGMVCEVMSGEDCDSLPLGFFYGDGSVCSDVFVECPTLPGPGACCYDHSVYGMVCEVMSEEDCDSLPLGFFYGDGSVCSDVFVECPTLPGPGACCYENDVPQFVCEQKTEEECAELGGMWYGTGVMCDDPAVDCGPPPLGACCIEAGQGSGNWSCVESTMEHCADNSGIWYGLGTLCSDSGIDCSVSHNCSTAPGSECARAPQYTDADYQIFGEEGLVAVQTAAPGMSGDRMLRVFDLSDIDNAPFNSDFALNRYAHADWNAANLGSILGLALDEYGSIFVTASQTWNTDVVGPSGWGAVYRIDTFTAAISTFAVLPVSGSSLGSITYDCDHNQFLVSSFEDGLIYRLDHGSGSVLGTYDHGAPWSGSPGPVTLGDRPFGLEVNGDRLYYAMWNEDMFNASSSVNNEIWSVRLDVTGAPIVGSELLEIVLPDLHAYGSEMYSSPVSDIDFSPSGTMVLGERTQGNITTLIATHARVLEYECLGGTWMPSEHEFHIGENYVSYANAAGGVDATEANVWASADAMHLGDPDLMWGIQGLPAGGGTIANSWLIDYNDDITTQDTAELGDLVIAPKVADGGGQPTCPTIAVGAIVCTNGGTPHEFSISFNVTNEDGADTITGVNMTVQSMYTLSPASATLSVPPSGIGTFGTTLTGGSPGQYFCIDMEITFQSGASCTETVCFVLPDCTIIVDPPGDFDGNGVVDVDDLMTLIARWAEVCDGMDAECEDIDLDDSGVIDMGDLLIVLGNWTV